MRQSTQNDELQKPERKWSWRTGRRNLKEAAGPGPEEKREWSLAGRRYISKGVEAGTNSQCLGNSDRGIEPVQEFTRGSNGREPGWGQVKRALEGLARKVGGRHDPGGVVRKKKINLASVSRQRRKLFDCRTGSDKR